MRTDIEFKGDVALHEQKHLVVEYSIIIVNYNGGSKLLDCLDSVFKHTTNFESFLVDNASADNSPLQVEERFPEVVVIRNSENLGFAGANNIGIRKAKGRWVVLLNPDTKVTENWLDNLVECARSSEDIGLVTPKLLYMDRRTINSTGHIFDFRKGFASDRGAGERDQGQYDFGEEVASCCFACVAIKREVVKQIGLLDAKMLLYYEDVDYSIRARLAGWKLMYCPNSVVLHHGSGATPRRKLPALLRRSTPYRLRIMLKNYNRRDAVKFGALSTMISMAAGLKNRNMPYFIGFALSPFWNILNFPVAERRSVQRTRRVPDTVLANFGSHVAHNL